MRHCGGGRKKYYCDVGFGGPGPKGLVCLDEDGVQEVYGEHYRCRWDGAVCTIAKDMDGQWAPLLQLIDAPCTQADFEVLLYYFTAKPDAHFVQNRAVNLCLPEGYLALNGNVFSGKRDGQSFRREVPEEEIPGLLKQEFGLVI